MAAPTTSDNQVRKELDNSQGLQEQKETTWIWAKNGWVQSLFSKNCISIPLRLESLLNKLLSQQESLLSQELRERALNPSQPQPPCCPLWPSDRRNWYRRIRRDSRIYTSRSWNPTKKKLCYNNIYLLNRILKVNNQLSSEIIVLQELFSLKILNARFQIQLLLRREKA